MERTEIQHIYEAPEEQEVKISGFLQTIRQHRDIAFLVLRDGTGTVQCTVTGVLLQETKSFPNESVLEIVGHVRYEKQAPGGVELAVQKICTLTEADELPIPVIEKSGETDLSHRMDYRWIDLRKPDKALIFKIWTVMEHAMREYFIENGYIQIHSPKLISSSTESGSELFRLDYFDKEAFLAQSPQLYKQMAICSGFEKVFEINPVYRANPSFTTRHDTEFTMIDIEMGFIENYTDLMDEEEKIIVAAYRAVKQKLGKKIKELYGIDTEVPVAPFPKIKLTEAKYILKTEYGIEGDDKYDLSPEEERAIGKHIREEYGHDFVFVTEYGTDARAFYTQKLEQEPEYSQSFDLLYRGIEITSGAKREHRVDTLSKQITHKGFSIEGFRDYLEFFRYGAPPHGGFAIGPSRLIMKLLGLPNVREATYIYRGINRLRP